MVFAVKNEGEKLVKNVRYFIPNFDKILSASKYRH